VSRTTTSGPAGAAAASGGLALALPGARAAIRRAVRAGGLGIAAISLWEVAMLIARGRVVPHGTADAWLATLVDRSGVAVRTITPAIAVTAVQLPPDVSADPADRLVAATARVEGAPLVSPDARLRGSPLVETIW
jgi:PIN domain nuclease of toxin-antitoxin system